MAQPYCHRGFIAKWLGAIHQLQANAFAGSQLFYANSNDRSLPRKCVANFVAFSISGAFVIRTISMNFNGIALLAVKTHKPTPAHSPFAHSYSGIFVSFDFALVSPSELCVTS